MEYKTYTLNDGRKIHLRSLQAKDRNQLDKFYSSLSESSLRWIRPLTPSDIDLRFRYPDYYIGLVTFHDGHAVGYGEITKDAQKCEGELNIHIHQDYQGVGLGTAMMIMLVKEATDNLLHSIKLKVAAGNNKAIHLFRKFGFQEEITTKGIDHRKQDDNLHMSKVLNR